MDSSHQPLSVSLQDIVGRAKDRLTLNYLLDHTEGRGLYLVMILLCLPFVTPVSIPGTSVVLGSMIMVLAFGLAMGWAHRLPNFIGGKTLPPERMAKVMRASLGLLRFLERFVRPRRTSWMSWRVARGGNALLIAFMAFLLALPLPPLPPCTNMFPSYAIIFLAVSMMEEDGLMIWVGYAAALGTVIYFWLMANLISNHLHHLFDWITK